MADDFLADVTRLVDAELTRLLDAPAEATTGLGHRGLMALIKTAVVAYRNESSEWHGRAAALAAVPPWTAALRGLQREDGLFSSGDNLASPPDSSFTVNDMAMVQRLLAPAVDGNTVLRSLAAELATVIERITPALVVGGVHTPNHRWEIASALARLDALTPDPDVRRRAEQWLAEGVDIADEGLYSERSPNYAAHVSNPSLICLALHLERPELLAPVHRNLHAQAALTDADGLVETVHSRRQDQGKRFSAAPFAVQYRRFALVENCATCSHEALRAPALDGREAVTALAELLAYPELTAPLPHPGDLAVDVDPDIRRFPSAGLVRIRSGRSVATVYGGSDVPHTGRIASGLACDPTFLRWRHGAVSLDSVRLSRNFFGLGPFRSEALRDGGSSPDGASVHLLHQRATASYYQPLDQSHQRAHGAYALEHEGRFAAAMSFSRRARDEVSLETDIAIATAADSVTVNARFDGVETSYAFELCFRPGGVLDGVRRLAETDCYELVDGEGTYRVGDDVVTFGPGRGSGPDRPPGYDPGEAYSFLSGTDATSGIRVYITGRTPGSHRLVARAGTT